MSRENLIGNIYMTKPKPAYKITKVRSPRLRTAHLDLLSVSAAANVIFEQGKTLLLTASIHHLPIFRIPILTQ